MWRVEGSEAAGLMLRRALADHAGDRDPIDWPLRTVVYARDELRAALAQDPDGALAAWAPRPPSTGSRHWDVLLSAVIGHEHDLAGQPAPAWTRRRLLRAWIPEHPLWTPAGVVEQTPPWLARARIFVPARDLETR